MNPNDPNLAMVEAVAERLGALRERLVFVGGCAGGLLITDPASPAICAKERRSADGGSARLFWI